MNMQLENAGTLLLLTDDASLLQKTLDENLKLEGYCVELAQNTYQAMVKLEAEAMNLMIIDDVVFSEEEYICDLKMISSLIPIIIMINPDRNLQVHELLRNGSIRNCIFKPFLPQSLAMLATNVIAKNQMRIKKGEGSVYFLNKSSNCFRSSSCALA